MIILLKQTPTGVSATIRCLPVATTQSDLSSKWKEWCFFGVFDHRINELDIEDDLEFLISKGELHG